jgi:CO/xanthine dehydrogenase FAD-binding subunit
MPAMASYHRPRELHEALAVLGNGGCTVLAGGTDYYPARVELSMPGDVLDISAISALRRIKVTAEHFRIGAGVTWSDLIRADLPACFDGLKLAAREIGGVQIQNAGTIAGNICNASPAADGMPNLLALEAVVELTSKDRLRHVPIGEFVTGNRRTQCQPQELVTGILVPRRFAGARSSFVKLGARRYLVISIVMVAAVVESRQGKVAQARIAVGSCSEVACRLTELEAALVGLPTDETMVKAATARHLAPLTPIDDVRASAAYRREAALVLVQRALSALQGVT